MAPPKDLEDKIRSYIWEHDAEPYAAKGAILSALEFLRALDNIEAMFSNNISVTFQTRKIRLFMKQNKDGHNLRNVQIGFLTKGRRLSVTEQEVIYFQVLCYVINYNICLNRMNVLQTIIEKKYDLNINGIYAYELFVCIVDKNITVEMLSVESNCVIEWANCLLHLFKKCGTVSLKSFL